MLKILVLRDVWPFFSGRSKLNADMPSKGIIGACMGARLFSIHILST